MGATTPTSGKYGVINATEIRIHCNCKTHCIYDNRLWINVMYQVAANFKKLISNGYLANSGALTKHSALYLRRLTTDLSGRYSCRVSSVHEDDFKSNDLTIYGN